MRVLSKIAVLIALALVGAGCGSDDEERPRAERTPTASPTAAPSTPEPEAEARPLPRGRPVRFRSSDGVALRGTLTSAGTASPAIVLVHELRGGADQWDPLVPDLHAAGFTTLAYGSRDPGELDERTLARDVAGALAFLRRRPEVDGDRLGIIGASIGGSTALFAIGTRQRRQLDAAVAMSPADSPLFIELSTSGRFRPHDVLFVTDSRERTNSENILPDAARSRIYEAPGVAHGVDLLPQEAVRREIVDWLKRRVA